MRGNTITISLHADLRADQWLLYHHKSTFVGDGMTHSQGHVRDARTTRGLVVVDGHCRRVRRSSLAKDERTAL